MRASEAEREAAVEKLRRHGADGRLDVVELEERIDAAFAARTRDELAELTADLPSLPREGEFAEHLRVYLVVMGLLVAIWALTCAPGHFWPIWPALGWGIGVASHWSAAGRPRRRAFG